MPVHLCCALLAWVVPLTGAAQGPPATLELLLPAGATATADGKAVADPRAVPVGDLKPDEIRRVKVAVTFADGATDERQVDIAAGQRVRVPVPRPGPERAATIAARPLTPVNAAAVSRDGRHIAVGLEDRAVVLWDTAAGRPVRTLAGHQKAVLAVAFSPDGSKLVSGSVDTTAVLWDVATGTRLRTFAGHAGPVASVAVGPGGARVLTGSPDGTAVLWDAATGERVHTLRAKEVSGVAVSPDGRTLATASGDNTAALWDAATGERKVVLRGHREGVICVAFSADGGRVLTGSSENIGLAWDAATGKRLAATGRHDTDVYAVAFTPDGRRMLSGEREDHIKLWEAGTGAHVRTFAGQAGDIVSIVPTADGRTFLSGSRDGTARVWDLATGRELLALTTDATGKAWAAVSPDGLFDGSEGGRRALGYRFPKSGFGEVDQFFADGYRPGLLAEVWRGERPLPAEPLGRSKPPLVKLVPPKSRTATDPTATLTADIADQGGGVGAVVVENNGTRLAVPTKAEPGANVTRVTFTVPLVPGANRIGVRAAARDGSRESAAAEIELAHPKAPGHRGRLYVVAVGVGEYAEKGWSRPSPKADAEAVAALLRDRAGGLFDRVDVVPVFDREATRTTIEDTVRDVAELSRPQDAIVVFVCGHGGVSGDKVYVAPHDFRPGEAIQRRGLAIDDIAAALGTARALNRVLVVETTAFDGDPKGWSEFGLRGTAERWGRSHGVHSLVAVGSTTPTLAQSLRDAAGGATDVTDWLRAAAGGRPGVEACTRARGFALLAAVK